MVLILIRNKGFNHNLWSLKSTFNNLNIICPEVFVLNNDDFFFNNFWNIRLSNWGYSVLHGIGNISVI